MGWVLVNLFCPNKCGSGGYNNYLEIVVNENNNSGIEKIEKFIDYFNKNGKKIRKGIRYLSVDNIIINYYDNLGQKKEIFRGNELNENMYEEIVNKIN